MSELSPNDFMLAWWRAQSREDEAELSRLKTIRFANPETIAALEKWVAEGKRIIAKMDEL
jgi:hypothetical protein